MLRGSVVIVVVVGTRQQAMLLAMITMRKSTHGFPLLSYMGMGLHLAALWVAGAPLIGSFRLDYEYEVEYEYDFSILLFRFHVITTHTHFIT